MNSRAPTCGCCPLQECQAKPVPCSANPDYCSQSNRTALLLSDTNTVAVQRLVSNLQSVGLTVNYISGGISNYTGSPNAANYDAVILITGNDYLADMPSSGQESIRNAQQNNGTGIVMTEWAAYHVLGGRWSLLSPLLLAARKTGMTASMSFDLVSINHPIWNGLAISFNTSVAFGYSVLDTPKNESIIIADCRSCGGPAVIVRPSVASTGRIVQIAHGAHYSSGETVFNWGNDANVVTMMNNAVKWSAKMI
ncbi:unnamed protein product [Rotaria sordida]|uniref:Uncharacterized protein n=1 Tax=Rotaria sordida TaxID=392033 RepID=A0A815CZM6_9BILA|nr:unnamed protein product [Rotaria sordida]CAF1563989.1 unnamed protein product [Rotaria sordida]